jgi:hypothetical protein
MAADSKLDCPGKSQEKAFLKFNLASKIKWTPV